MNNKIEKQMCEKKTRKYGQLLSLLMTFIGGCLWGNSLQAQEASLSEMTPLIQTIDITPVNPDTYGLQSGEGTVIPLDIWKGLTQAQVRALLEKLHPHQTHPILRRLQKQLMLAGTNAPDKCDAQQGNILAFRLKHLEAMHDIESAYLLAKQYPEALEGSDWLWLQFLNALMLDHERDAVKIAQEALEKYPEDLKWSKAMIGLQLLKGEHEAALLGLSLLEEKKTQELNAFLTLARQKAEKKATVPDFYPKDFLEWKLFMHGNVGKEERDEFLPFFLKSKQFHALSPQEKLLVGEQAFLKGIWTKEQLISLYQDHAPVSPKKSIAEGSMNDEIIAMPEVPLDFDRDDPLLRARICTLIATEEGAEKKAKLLYQGLQHIMKHKRFFLMPTFTNALKSLPVQASFRGYAKYFAQALLMEGEKTLAVRWLSLASMEDKVTLAPWIIFGVDDISLSAKQALFSTWYAAQDSGKQNALTLGIFEALVPGVTENRSVLLPLSSVDMGGIETGLLLPLHFALTSQKGVAFVYTLLLGQEVFRSTKPSSCLPLVVGGLKSLGYEKEARLIALDALQTA